MNVRVGRDDTGNINSVRHVGQEKVCVGGGVGGGEGRGGAGVEPMCRAGEENEECGWKGSS